MPERSERAEDMFARLVALAFKADHVDLFLPTTCASSTPAELPKSGTGEDLL